MAQALYKGVHIVSAPIVLVGYSAVIAHKLLVVGNGLASSRVRVKVVVDVYSVYIIARNDVVYHATDVLAVFR